MHALRHGNRVRLVVAHSGGAVTALSTSLPRVPEVGLRETLAPLLSDGREAVPVHAEQVVVLRAALPQVGHPGIDILVGQSLPAAYESRDHLHVQRAEGVGLGTGVEQR